MVPKIVIEGIDEIIKRDLAKHKAILERSKLELQSYKQSRSHEIKKKRHYNGLIGGGKYDDDSLKKSMGDIGTNIRHISDKVKLTDDAIKHHTTIVDHLTEQLKNHEEGMKELRRDRMK